MCLIAPVTKENSWKTIFFPFWFSQALSLLGSSIVKYALVWWLTNMVRSAPVLAAASTFAILPEININPFAGAIVDRINRKHITLATGAAIAMPGLAVQFYLDFYRNSLSIQS